MNEAFIIEAFDKKYEEFVILFLKKCLPQSGRTLDLEEWHSLYLDIEKNFAYFWCMFDRSTGKNKLIGTIAVRDLGAGRCELKSVYLLEKYHGRGLGYMMLQTAVSKAREAGYSAMYLDTMSSSRKAIALYEKAGFIMTDRYNESPFTDVFMVMPIQQKAGGAAG